MFQGSGAQQSSSSDGQGHQGHGGGHESFEGGDENITHLRRVLEDTHGKLSKTSKELDGLKSEYKKTSDFNERIRRAVVGDEEEKKKPGKKDKYGQLMDHYLAQDLDMQKKHGQGMPLTTNLAVEFFEHAMEQESRWDQAQSELAELKNLVKQLTNPMNRLADNAYASIDSSVIDALETIYGRGEDAMDVKRAQYGAVSQLVGNELKRLRQEEPDLYEEVIRDPKKQARLARHFVERNLPPRARQMIQEDAIKRTPMSNAELMQAFREAGQMQDPDQRAKVREKIRQEMLMSKFGGGQGNLRGLYGRDM